LFSLQAVPDWDAQDEISFVNITVSGFIPEFLCDQCVLRLKYHSGNPLENATWPEFYRE
jgi:hypothetical protein